MERELDFNFNSYFGKKVKEDIITYFGFVEGNCLLTKLEESNEIQKYIEEIYYETNKDIKQAKVMLLRLELNGYETNDLTVNDIRKQIKAIRRKMLKLSVQNQLYEMRKYKHATETENNYIVRNNRKLFINLEIMKDTIRQGMGVIM